MPATTTVTLAVPCVLCNRLFVVDVAVHVEADGGVYLDRDRLHAVMAVHQRQHWN